MELNSKVENIAFIGFGALGKQIYNMISLSEKKRSYRFFDDIMFKEGKANVHLFQDYIKEAFSTYNFYICLGYKHLERKLVIVNELTEKGYSLPHCIHKTSFINTAAKIGHATIIYPMCNIDIDVNIGKGVLLNNSVVISHNSVIKDACYIAPGVIISGFVEIQESTFIGSGSVISNNIKIGKNVIIGAGTVVTKDIPDNTSVIGNPMKILNKKLNLI